MDDLSGEVLFTCFSADPQRNDAGAGSRILPSSSVPAAGLSGFPALLPDRLQFPHFFQNPLCDPHVQERTVYALLEGDCLHTFQQKTMACGDQIELRKINAPGIGSPEDMIHPILEIALHQLPVGVTAADSDLAPDLISGVEVSSALGDLQSVRRKDQLSHAVFYGKSFHGETKFRPVAGFLQRTAPASLQGILPVAEKTDQRFRKR